MNGGAKDDEDGIFVGSRDDGPASKFGGAIEEAKHWIEEKHLGKEGFPFLKPFFGIGEKIGNKSKW